MRDGRGAPFGGRSSGIVEDGAFHGASTAPHGRGRAGSADLGTYEAYVRETGLYDRVLTYDAVDTLTAPPTTTYVDFSAGEDGIAAVHRALGVNLAAAF